MMKYFLLLLLSLATTSAVVAQHTSTIKEQMNIVQKEYGVHFVYNNTMVFDIPYKGKSLPHHNLSECLDFLFKDIYVEWKVYGKNIALKKVKRQKRLSNKKYTVSGYVRDMNKESIISATIYDLSTGNATISNAYGFFSLTLPEGKHRLKISYVGFNDQVVEVQLLGNKSLDISLSGNNTLAEVVVQGDLNSPLLNTQTGKRTLTAKDLNTEFSLLSSPDVVKTLQRTSGVAEGVELASGLYVHGGGNDENLFLLDGTPLYQINHSLGLFSSFNTDIIKTVDFYKSGFPARYSGRLSSITDVRTRDGNMKETHGSYSIGLLDGRFQIEGPIMKEKTSFNFGLRRSWMDLFLRPAFAVINKSNTDGEHYSFGYLFHDLNGKITHRFSDRSKAYISVYSGLDKYNIHDKSVWSSSVSDTKNNFNWGNTNLAINWNYQFNHKMFMNIAGIYTRNRSIHEYSENDTEHNGELVKRTSLDIQKNRSKIYDVGVKADFDYRPDMRNRILFGGSFTHHLFKPQTLQQVFYFGDKSEDCDTSVVKGTNTHRSDEITLYAEDEWRMNRRFSADFGLNYSMFSIKGRTFSRLDPRMAMKYQITDYVSAKASYTMMSQYVHRIANTFLEIPTDFWVPTTKDISPMHSSQLAGGIYAQVNKKLLLTIEGFYKYTKHIIQYRNWMGLQPPASLWDKNVMDGNGKSYGAELDIKYQSSGLTLTVAYTLLWSKRKFDGFYNGWFRDKFDNRHRINIVGRYQLGRHSSMYAAWTYHSGNRMTLPTQYANTPMLPGDQQGDTGYFYEMPNNIGMPAYHRLDVGFDFHKLTKRHHERIWNISLYNAYCHLNTMYANINQDDDGKFYSKCRGYIPIIPSVSYTIKF